MEKNKLLLLVWSLVIAILTLAPSPIPGVEERLFHLDKLVHFGMFFVFAYLITRWKKSIQTPILTAAIILSLLYGISIEYLQGFLGRDFDYLDMLADGLGAIALVAIADTKAYRWLNNITNFFVRKK